MNNTFRIKFINNTGFYEKTSDILKEQLFDHFDTMSGDEAVKLVRRIKEWQEYENEETEWELPWLHTIKDFIENDSGGDTQFLQLTKNIAYFGEPDLL